MLLALLATGPEVCFSARTQDDSRGKVRIVLKCKNNQEGGLTRSISYLKLLFLQPTSDAESFGYKSRLFTSEITWFFISN